MKGSSYLLIVGTLLSILLFAYSVRSYHAAVFGARTLHRAFLHKSLDEGAQTIDTQIKKITVVGHDVGRLAEQKLSREEMENGLKTILKTYAAITSVSIAYAPDAYKSDTKFTSIQVAQQNDTFIVQAIEDSYNYLTTNWYVSAQAGIESWSGSFADPVSNKVLLRYTTPFYIFDPIKKSHQFAGAANVSLEIGIVNNFVMSLTLDKRTFPILIDHDGTILAHPTQDLALEQKNISDLARQPGKSGIIDLSNLIKKHEEGALNIFDTYQKRDYYTLFKKVPHTPWTLILMGAEENAFIPNNQIRHIILWCILSCALMICMFVTTIASIYWPLIEALWISAICFTALLTSCIAAIWSLDIMSVQSTIIRENVVDTEVNLERFFFLQKRINSAIYKEAPYYIPTGLFLYALEVNPTDSIITINGYIWQKYNHAVIPSALEPSIVIFNALEQSFEKIYSTTNNNIETIGWRFRAKIKGQFSFRKYPFDEQEITLSLGHKDYTAQVILVPDFDAFSTGEAQKPEIDPKADSGQWSTKNTYSYYELTDYTTDFGIKNYARQKGFPILNFAITMRRNYVYPLTASALPIVIIFMVMFTIVLFTGLHKKREALPGEIIKLTSGIFFTAAVAHQTFQRTLQSSTITYFEYFYFMLYIVILLATVNGMLYGYGRGGRFINYEDNLFVRLLYWPLTMSAGLLLTLYFFY